MKNNSLSKFLSLVLRHKPETIDIKLDNNGYVLVTELLDKMKLSGNELTFDELKYVVDTNDKKRFAFNEDFSKIRASQGHTINVDLKMKNTQPPFILYHGTSITNKESIIKNGINKGKRNHVHLSIDIETATKVGSRHGKPIIFEVSAKEMYNDKNKFFLSENNVWLTDFIDSKYVKLI